MDEWEVSLFTSEATEGLSQFIFIFEIFGHNILCRKRKANEKNVWRQMKLLSYFETRKSY